MLLTCPYCLKFQIARVPAAEGLGGAITVVIIIVITIIHTIIITITIITIIVTILTHDQSADP